MKALTRRQSQILALLDQENSLTMRELAHMLGISSPATVHKHVSNLKKLGFLTGQKSRAQKPNQIAIIGGISKGKKIELFAKASFFDLPPSLATATKTLYGFLIKDNSFTELQMQSGDLLIIEAKQNPKFGELILAQSKDSGVAIGKPEDLSGYQIQGVILQLIRNYSQ